MEPTGQPTSAEVRATMHAQYQECLSLLERLHQGAGALVLVRMSVQNLGKLDVYQWIYFLSHHARRHIPQIEGVYREALTPPTSVSDTAPDDSENRG